MIQIYRKCINQILSCEIEGIIIIYPNYISGFNIFKIVITTVFIFFNLIPHLICVNVF